MIAVLLLGPLPVLYVVVMVMVPVLRDEPNLGPRRIPALPEGMIRLYERTGLYFLLVTRGGNDYNIAFVVWWW